MAASERSGPRTRGALKVWLKSSPFRGRVGDFANYLDVPRKTVEDWCYKGVIPSNKHHKARLFVVTGLDIFTPKASDLQIVLNEEILWHRNRQNAIKGVQERLVRLQATLKGLKRDLLELGQGSVVDRQLFRDSFASSDLSFIANLLLLLLDEKRFQRWKELNATIGNLEKDYQE